MLSRLFLLTSFLLAGAAPSAAQASQAGPRLFPRAARAPGVQETTYDAVANHYLFTLKSELGTTLVQYRLPLGHAHLAAGVLRIEETTTGAVPMEGGGLTYRDVNPGPAVVGRVLTAQELAFSTLTDPLHTATLLAHALDPVTKEVTLRFRDDYLVGGTPVPSEKKYVLRLVGRSLEIHATSDFSVRNIAQYNHAGFAFDTGSGLAQPSLAFHVPYMDMVPVFVGADGVFVTRIVDWYASNASEGIASPDPTAGATFQGETKPTYYRNDALELNAPVDETVYITVSHDVADVMPIVDRHPSAYRRHMADRAVSQAAPGVLYTSDEDWVIRAQSLGMADMAHIKWDWSKWPFNLNDPDILPDAPGVPCGTIWGTEQEWLDYTDTAAQGNWTFAPYFLESSNDPGYEDSGGPVLELPGSAVGSVELGANPLFDPLASVRDAANVAKLGWDTELNLEDTNLEGLGVGHPVELIGPHLRPAMMAAVAAKIHGSGSYTPFTVAGAHIDAATGIPDWNEIDQRKLSAFPKTIAENLMWREQSFGALKDGMDGPLFGENSHWRSKAFESYAAGLLDGTSRKIPIHWTSEGPANAPNKDYLVVPDFELSEVMTKATGFFGMGWEWHFDTSGPWGFSDAFVDGWNATLLSYGHAPYFGTNGDVSNNYWDWRRNIRSYFLCHGVSEAMRTSTIEEVRYVTAGGTELTLSQALVQVAAGTLQLESPRLVLRFANGLEFKANHSSGNWSTTVLGQAYDIPPDGFAAAMPNGLLALSVIDTLTNWRVDYAFNPGHSEMIDRRGQSQSYNGFPGALLPVPASLTQFAGVSDVDMVIVKDLRTNRAIYGAGLIEGSISLGASAAPAGLTVEADDTSTLSSGRPRIGVRAVLTDFFGGRRDVTGLCTWSSSDPAKVEVNRFGGLTMKATGSATITATLASPAMSATHVVNATRRPVLTGVVQEALTPTKAFLSFTTDAACSTSIDLQNLSTGTIVTLAGRPDPAQKVHQFAFRSLTSGTSYLATPTAVNAGGLSTTGASFGFTTP
jgi:hypothetical protein